MAVGRVYDAATNDGNVPQSRMGFYDLRRFLSSFYVRSCIRQMMLATACSISIMPQICSGGGADVLLRVGFNLAKTAVCCLRSASRFLAGANRVCRSVFRRENFAYSSADVI